MGPLRVDERVQCTVARHREPEAVANVIGSTIAENPAMQTGFARDAACEAASARVL